MKISRKFVVFILLCPLLFWSCSNDSNNGNTSNNTVSTDSSSNNTTTDTVVNNTTSDTTAKIASAVSGNIYVLSKFISTSSSIKNHNGIEFNKDITTKTNNIITEKYYKDDTLVLKRKVTINADSTWTYQENDETPVTITNLNDISDAANKTRDALKPFSVEHKFNNDKTGVFNNQAITWSVNSDGTVKVSVTMTNPSTKKEMSASINIHSDDDFATWYFDGGTDVTDVKGDMKLVPEGESQKAWLSKKS